MRQEHPLAKTYKMRALPSYNDLDIIFASPAEQQIVQHIVQEKDLDDDASAAQMSELNLINHYRFLLMPEIKQS